MATITTVIRASLFNFNPIIARLLYVATCGVAHANITGLARNYYGQSATTGCTQGLCPAPAAFDARSRALIIFGRSPHELDEHDKEKPDVVAVAIVVAPRSRSHHP